MAKQTVNGKAFEYACLSAIELKYSEQVIILKDQSPAYLTAKKSYDEIDANHQRLLKNGAHQGVEILDRLEANLNSFSQTDTLALKIQADASGQLGDVRDIVITKAPDWEIGISAKHNHEAVKHSRISASIDFGEKWLELPCSNSYMEEVDRIFLEVEPLIGVNWSDAHLDKASTIYKPLLNAFSKELSSLYKEYGSIVPQNLVKYLLGSHDFYKFILDVDKKLLKVNAYNLYGNLNKNTSTAKSLIKLPKLKLPNRIIHIGYLVSDGVDSDNTLELICDNGWQFSFRIHNASSRIERSMKFDIQLIGVPADIQSFIGVI